MSVLTIASPAAMTGPVRRVKEHGPRYRIEVRSVSASGEQVTRTFAFFDKASAELQFKTLRALGDRAYSSGRYRLVLIDTEG